MTLEGLDSLTCLFVRFHHHVPKAQRSPKWIGRHVGPKDRAEGCEHFRQIIGGQRQGQAVHNES